MKYYKITVSLTPKDVNASDIMQAQMGEKGFECFTETAEGFEGYIQRELFGPETMEGVEPLIDGVSMTWAKEEAPDEDWNKEWEKNFFQPIDIDGRCTIRGTFHPANPTAEHEILINPQMAFGTGHHETTRLMVSWLLDNDVTGLDMMDMGCGTGVLGILALKRGARNVIGIDIDEWSVSNAKDNIALNGTTGMEVRLGGAEAAQDLVGQMDVVLANINRNILMRDMDTYAAALRPGGTLVLSGFYDMDRPHLEERARQAGLEPQGMISLNKWSRIVMKKN